MTKTDRALALARKLAALPEAPMRERVLAERLAEAEAEEIAPVLAEILLRGQTGGPPFNVALRALVAVIGHDQLSYSLQSAIYRVAKERGDHGLMQLFFTDVPIERSRAVEPQRELTLGHRKTLARSRDHDVLQRLMCAPEPEVIVHLLDNPRLTEEDVVRLAARRPAEAEVQRLIGASNRWIARYRVKRALVLNPWTPVDLATRLLGFLVGADLRLVRSSPTLPERLRQAAEGVAAGRRHSSRD